MKINYRGHANKSGVYKITNTTNGKVYIGSAKRFKQRVSEHKSSLKNNKHQNKHLQASFNKHGTDAFLFEVIEVVPGDKVARTTREQEHLNQFHENWGKCFNSRKRAVQEQGPWSKTPEETRKKLSENAKKQWQDPAYRKRRSEAMKKMWEDPEYKKHMSKAHKGHKRTPEQIEKLRQANLGRKHTEEARKNMSEAQRKRKPISEESRKNMSEAIIKKWQDPEYRAKLVASHNTPESLKLRSKNSKANWDKIAAMSEADKLAFKQANRKRALKNGMCTPVEQWSRDGKTLIKIWPSLAEAAREVERVDTGTLIKHFKPGSKRKSVGGYTWKRHT